MKKILSIVLVLAMAFSICMVTGCGKDDSTETSSDLQYIQDKGTLVVGITEFAPMDYRENQDSEEWIGFDADMAKAFADSLGVDVEFKVINWDYKITELDNKGIDCVWNGMTLNDEVKAGMSVSNAYCNNAQVVVVKKDVADKYQTVDSIKKLQFAVEAGSAGEKMAKEYELNYIGAEAQADTLMEVSAGTSDASIIDLLMAGAMIGEGTDYAGLTYTVELNSEEYGVGFRKGSDVVDKINEFFKTAYDDGSMLKIAEKYGVQESLIEQK